MIFYVASIIKRYDWVMIGAALFLVALGMLSIFSTSQGDFGILERQVVWLIIGLGLMVAVSMVDYRVFRLYPQPILLLYGIGILALLALFVFGSTIRGSRGWIELGIINIEPAEAIKPVIVLLLAKYFSMRHVEIYRFRHIVVSGMYVLLPAILIFLQPELGSLAVILGVWFGLMLFAGIKLRHVAALVVLTVLLAGLLWGTVLADYQKDRFSTFLDPRADPQGQGYNVIQSTTAVFSGGILGKGIGNGTQVQLGFLPENQTDFIFAAIGEELGLVGIGALLIALSVLLIRIIHVARIATNNFARFAALGFMLLILLQASINIAMNIGLLPVTGIPLPFVSYGGSSMITLFMVLGFLQSIHLRSS